MRPEMAGKLGPRFPHSFAFRHEILTAEPLIVMNISLVLLSEVLWIVIQYLSYLVLLFVAPPLLLIKFVESPERRKAQCERGSATGSQREGVEMAAIHRRATLERGVTQHSCADANGEAQRSLRRDAKFDSRSGVARFISDKLGFVTAAAIVFVVGVVVVGACAAFFPVRWLMDRVGRRKGDRVSPDQGKAAVQGAPAAPLPLSLFAEERVPAGVRHSTLNIVDQCEVIHLSEGVVRPRFDPWFEFHPVGCCSAAQLHASNKIWA